MATETDDGKSPESESSPLVEASADQSSGVDPFAFEPLAVRKAFALKEYAISKGIEVPDECLQVINRAYHQSKEPGRITVSPPFDSVTFDRAVRDLSRLTFPTTVDSIIIDDDPGTARKIRNYKWALPILGLLALGIAVWSFSSQPTKVGLSILAAMLGLLGSVVYQMFNVIGVIREKAFTVDDIYTNILRMILGPIMGWVFFFTFSRSAFESGQAGTSNQNPLQQTGVLLLLIPFIAGFSTKLVIGIMEQSIRAVMLIFGIEDKQTEINLRQKAGAPRKTR
jgi:hypothetical protein